MFTTVGKIKYYETWAIAWVDDEIRKYYSRLCPKAWYIKPPANPAHCTFVRKLIETPDQTHWKKYDGHDVLIEYDNIVKSDGLYFWLNCYSERLEEIRLELGLERFRAGFQHFHITIGNLK